VWSFLCWLACVSYFLLVVLPVKLRVHQYGQDGGIDAIQNQGTLKNNTKSNMTSALAETLFPTSSLTKFPSISHTSVLGKSTPVSHPMPFPLASPSTVPSTIPSAIPTTFPSAVPSQIPSLYPSQQPSIQPSMSLSAIPSAAAMPDNKNAIVNWVTTFYAVGDAPYNELQAIQL